MAALGKSLVTEIARSEAAFLVFKASGDVQIELTENHRLYGKEDGLTFGLGEGELRLGLQRGFGGVDLDDVRATLLGGCVLPL